MLEHQREDFERASGKKRKKGEAKFLALRARGKGVPTPTKMAKGAEFLPQLAAPCR